MAYSLGDHLYTAKADFITIKICCGPYIMINSISACLIYLDVTQRTEKWGSQSNREIFNLKYRDTFIHSIYHVSNMTGVHTRGIKVWDFFIIVFLIGIYGKCIFETLLQIRRTRFAVQKHCCRIGDLDSQYTETLLQIRLTCLTVQKHCSIILSCP